MLKTKKLFSIIVMLSLVLSTSLVSGANAASLTLAQDRLSDSDLSIPATHVVAFTTHFALASNDYFEVTLPVGFGNMTDGTWVSCPGSMTPSVPGQPSRVARCTATGAVVPGAYTMSIVKTVTNPAVTGSYSVGITSYVSAALKESVNVMVAIVSSINVTANVPSSLVFNIVPLATSSVVNGATTTGASATTSLGFGSLQIGTSSVLGQQLQVTTNANYGFKVTVEQDQNLTSQSGATIDSFQNNTPPGSPVIWTAPTGTLDATTTYGHMGFTTDDISLSAGNPYGGDKWMGFAGSTTQEVMYHTGPADGSTQSKGSVKVAYQIQITGLQEAGDYINTLTYVATPTY